MAGAASVATVPRELAVEVLTRSGQRRMQVLAPAGVRLPGKFTCVCRTTDQCGRIVVPLWEGDRLVKEWDANSMLSRYRASRNFDASKPFGGDMMKALAQIKAPALLLPSMSDRTIPGYLTRELFRGLRGKVTYAEIPSIRGHAAGGLPPGTAEYAYVSEKIRKFLAGLSS